jgi:hypothetical protein
MTRPSVFIGSSSEGLRIAQNVKAQLSSDSEITIWHEGVFGLNQGTLEGLLNALETFEFAILVLTPDDMVESRKKSIQSPRDNVLFECGLFLGRLGRERTFIVYDADKEIKIPSDLAGVMLASFRGNRKDGNLLAAVEEACFKIRNAIEKYSTPQMPDRKLHTEYKLGKNLYRETLELYISENNQITGKRHLEWDRGTSVYEVQGFSGTGFYFFEYHAMDGSGGGAVVLHHVSAGKEIGLILAPNCDTGARNFTGNSKDVNSGGPACNY